MRRRLRSLISAGEMNFDYFSGRAIKTDISGDSVNPRRYDEYMGQGAVVSVVSSLRGDKDDHITVKDACCANGEKYSPYGEPMLGNDHPDTVMCGNCGLHVPCNNK